MEERFICDPQFLRFHIPRSAGSFHLDLRRSRALWSWKQEVWGWWGWRRRLLALWHPGSREERCVRSPCKNVAPGVVVVQASNPSRQKAGASRSL